MLPQVAKDKAIAMYCTYSISAEQIKYWGRSFQKIFTISKKWFN